MALPSELLRFPDLKRVGIRNYPTLKRWQKKEGFPSGRRIGPNTTVWTREEVESWWDSRPKADPPPENVKPAPLRQEGSRRVVKEDRHQSSTASESESQVSEKSEAA
jgi:predicted DNA-binding transcriptional regulator AlpA